MRIETDIRPGTAVRIGIWARDRIAEFARNGKMPPTDLVKLGDDLSAEHVFNMVSERGNAARCRRYQARKRGEVVPLRKPGRPRKAA